MLANKVARIILLILFLIFIALYISESTGYYDYGAYKKTLLTKEQIKKFEQDVKEGKDVSVKDYVGDLEKNYNNKLSNTGLTLSKNIEKYSKKAIETVFGALSDFINS